MSPSRKGIVFAVAAFGVVALSATAAVAASKRANEDPIKAAWIYVGPKNDGGWSQAHDAGRQYVEKKLGDKVKTTFKENVPEDSQVAQVIEGLVRDGNKIIFATSFGFQDAMAAAAKAHPDVKFEQATGFKTGPNLAEFFGAGEEAIYLSGMAAGAATKNGTIGYVVPFAIPEVIRHANAFTLGAQSINPKVKVRVIWTKSWFDPTKERKAAEALIGAGADVLGQNVDSPSAGIVAEKKGVPWVGYDSDARDKAPKSWLTAAVYNWGPYYAERVQAAADGSWKTGDYYGNIKDGFTDIAPFGKRVSAATRAKIKAKRAAIIKGKLNLIFKGPIRDQAGKVRIAAGKLPSLGDILSQDWFVKGIVGNPKG
jgi:basic membrane protein A and related proteins